MAPIKAGMQNVWRRRFQSAIKTVKVIHAMNRDPQASDPVSIDPILPQVKDLVVKRRWRAGKDLKEKVLGPPTAQAGDQVDDSAGCLGGHWAREDDVPRIIRECGFGLASIRIW